MQTIGVITLAPEMFDCLKYSIIGRAIDRKIINLKIFNLRNWAQGTYRKVDDSPYGGGAGMVLMYEPLRDAITAAKKEMPKDTKVVYLSPRGMPVRQKTFTKVRQDLQPILFISARYEGIDERIIENYIDEHWSLGDYVLSNGELAAMVLIDAIGRLLPDSLNNDASSCDESFTDEILEYPQYTRPQVVDGLKVPDVLVNGNHSEICKWRRKQALGKTWLSRPDLLEKINLNEIDEQLLREFRCECD